MKNSNMYLLAGFLLGLTGGANASSETARKAEEKTIDQELCDVVRFRKGAGSVMRLLEEGANPNAGCTVNWVWTPFLYAVREGDVPTVMELIKAGADVTQHLTYGGGFNLRQDSPDRVAREYGHYGLANMLEAYFFLFMFIGNVEKLSAELPKVPYVDARRHQGMTLLILAIKKCQQDDCIDYIGKLLEAGANVDLEDDSGHGPLYYAVTQGLEQVSAFLVTEGANLDKVAEQVSTMDDAEKQQQALELIAKLREK